MLRIFLYGFIFSTTHGSGIKIYIVVVLNQIEEGKKSIIQKKEEISVILPIVNTEYTRRNSKSEVDRKAIKKKKTRTTRKHDPIWEYKRLGLCKF